MASWPTFHRHREFFGGYDRRIGRRCHHRVCFWGCQELWAQDPRRQSGLQSTRFHAESPRIRHLTFLNHERQYFIGIRHSTGLSLHHEHCHAPLFLKRFRKEADSSGSVRQAVLDWCLISAWWRRPPVRVIPMVTRGLGTKSTSCWICK